MFYLCLAVTLMWMCHLAYFVVIDRQARQLRHRLDAREGAHAENHTGLARSNCHAEGARGTNHGIG